jgi:regulator of protease activity HflC (stomatin/prohibitin superfamily)
MSDAKVAVTADQLKDILSTVITEARKPVKTEEQIRAEQEKAQARAELAETLRQKAANDRRIKLNCTHMRSNGTTTATYIQNGGYLLCLGCQATIRSGEAPKEDYPSADIYSTEMFNRLFQLQQQSL